MYNVYELVRAFFMQHHNLQSNIFLYCNILQYKNHGKRDRRCLTSGLFYYGIVNELTEITEPPYYSQERFVFIPTRPEYPGDTGYINLQSLAAGNEVWYWYIIIHNFLITFLIRIMTLTLLPYLDF